MPRNKSEKDPVRTACMVYARACQAFLACGHGTASHELEALLCKRKDAYLAIPPEGRNGLGWGPRTNLRTIIERYGEIDAT